MGCSDSDLDSRGSLARNVSVIRDRLCVCLSRQTGVRTPCRSSCHASGKHSLPARLLTRTCLSSFSQSQPADNDISDIIFARLADVKLDATLTSDLKWKAAQALPIQGYSVGPLKSCGSHRRLGCLQKLCASSFSPSDSVNDCPRRFGDEYSAGTHNHLCLEPLQGAPTVP